MSWIGVDLDGTLAHHRTEDGRGPIGAPIPDMVARTLGWLAAGREVRIFTSRVAYADAPDQIAMIDEWCLRHLGRTLRVTCVKDGDVDKIYDDHCVQVEKNTGRLIG